MKLFRLICSLLLIFFSLTQPTVAGTLSERLEQFPQWQGKPSVKIALGDLVYPDWMAGTWNVTSTLVNLVAPLAPEIVTPGLQGNSSYLNKPVEFQVKFNKQYSTAKTNWLSFVFTQKQPVVADRAFNALNIARAYLGNRAVLSVKVDPNNPNQQITFLRNNSQLLTTVTGRRTETPAPYRFIATEITQQQFRDSEIYFNEVETETSYQLLFNDQMEAVQVTAIYLSPQDPNYFAAAGRPVALGRYRLKLLKNTER